MDNTISARQLAILYVECDDALRNETARLLQRHVGEIFAAANGEEGLALFRKYRPDLVISSVALPLMDGMQLAQEIKHADGATPVILTTLCDDAGHVQNAIRIGIDGYLLQPVSIDQLLQAIEEATARQFGNRELAKVNAQLSAYQEMAEEERRLVAELMDRMMRPEQLHDKQVRYWIQPTEVVSGDLVAVSRSRNGRLYVMLADSTGHGLPAALNLLPINHIFYSMVSKGLAVGMIVEEMNWAVHEQSPTGRYVAAVVACIDSHNCTVEVWNGGIPPAYFLGADGDVAFCFSSSNLPLGILDRTFTAQTEMYQWPSAGQLVIYSDGLVDAESAAGEAFGEHRVLSTLQRHATAARHDALVAAVNEFLGTRHAFDDMTLMAVDCPGGIAARRAVGSGPRCAAASAPSRTTPVSV